MKSYFVRAALAAGVCTGLSSFVVDDAQAARLSIRDLAHPNVFFVLDDSASMHWISQMAGSCPWFEAQFGVWSPGILTNGQLMQAALTGCNSAADGSLSLWNSWVPVQAVATFGYPTQLASPFGDPLASRLAAVQSMSFAGGTPLNQGLGVAAQHIAQYFAANPSTGDEPIVIILISDGVANGGSTSFYTACNGAFVTANDMTNVTAGAAYLASNDLVCTVPGVQSAEVHTIGINTTAMTQLANIAAAGNGTHHLVSSVAEMQNAINQIIVSAILP